MRLLLALLATLTAAAPTRAGELEDASTRLAARAKASRPRVTIEPTRGAWFRKVVGPEGVEVDGLEAWGVLPKPSFDPARAHAAVAGEAAYISGPLDRPDIYLGLHADGAELDAGLIWDHVYDGAKKDTGEMAYRVYWRTKGGGWKNPEVGAADNVYLRPGDRFALTLRANADGTARLAVRRAGKRGASVAFVIPVPGLLGADGKLKPRAFRRVHSIDQFRLDGGLRAGNEGHAAIPTATTLKDGRWEGAHLLMADGTRRAFSGDLATPAYGADAAERYGSVFPAAGVGEGGAEEIVVLPPKP